MKNSSTFVLKGTIVLLGAAVLALCVFVLPGGLRGGGYYIPVVIGMYLAAIPFYLGLFEAWRLLDHIQTSNAFSEVSVKALKHIKYYAIAISGLYVAFMPFIYTAADKDDAPGVLAIGLVIVFASAVVAVFSAVLQRLIENAIEIKSENDLTV